MYRQGYSKLICSHDKLSFTWKDETLCLMTMYNRAPLNDAMGGGALYAPQVFYVNVSFASQCHVYSALSFIPLRSIQDPTLVVSPLKGGPPTRNTMRDRLTHPVLVGSIPRFKPFALASGAWNGP